MEFEQFIYDNYSELLDFHTLVPAVERLIDDIQLNNNLSNLSNLEVPRSYA